MSYKCRICGEPLIREWSIGRWVWAHLRWYRHDPVPVFMGYDFDPSGDTQ
jgi:hypothetical protein